jgi:hypothetical protein
VNCYCRRGRRGPPSLRDCTRSSNPAQAIRQERHRTGLSVRFKADTPRSAHGREQSESSAGYADVRVEVAGRHCFSRLARPARIALQHRRAKSIAVPSCTRSAHASFQPFGVRNESFRSIIGATHNRCDKLFIRLRFLTFSRSNGLLERPVILSPCKHDWLCCAAAWYSQVGSRVRMRRLSVHT